VPLSAAEAYEVFLVPALVRPWAEMVLNSDPPALAARMVGAAGAVIDLDSDEGRRLLAEQSERRGGALASRA